MKVKFTLLGCGYSMGVPRIDGYFGECNPKEKKNYRTRCSAAISYKKKNFLIDTSPDIKYQLLQNKIKNVDGVFYTHSHADQTHGINDLRVFYLKHMKRIPVYADKNTKRYLLKNFRYCFIKNSEYPPTLKMNNLKKVNKIKVDNKILSIESILVEHGNIDCIAYILNKKLGYASDISEIYKKDLKKFYNLKYFVVDCLRYKKHYSHFNFEKVLNLVKIIRPKLTILTNLNTEMDYLKLKKILPKNIVPGYDGMKLSI